MTTELNDLVIAGLGIATVFAALVCIIGICNITGAIFTKLNGKNADGSDGESNSLTGVGADTQASAAPAQSYTYSNEYVRASIQNRGEVIAAISAAIAEDCGADISKIRILSVRERANSIPDRARLCAAISAVICEETGAAGVRIHSIRRTMPDRARLCAAISAVISEETGAEHVRIHSIRQI